MFDISSFISEFISDFSCKTSLIRSGLLKPFNVASVWTIAIKTFQKNAKNILLTRYELVKTYLISFVVKKHVCFWPQLSATLVTFLHLFKSYRSTMLMCLISQFLFTSICLFSYKCIFSTFISTFFQYSVILIGELYH